MKTIFLILSIVQVIVGPSVRTSNRCDITKKDPYPGDVTKFIVCDNFIPVAKKCPVGLEFNPVVEVCETGNFGNQLTTDQRPAASTNNYGSRVVVLPAPQPIYTHRENQGSSNYQQQQQQRYGSSGAKTTTTTVHTSYDGLPSGSGTTPGGHYVTNPAGRPTGQYHHNSGSARLDQSQYTTSATGPGVFVPGGHNSFGAGRYSGTDLSGSASTNIHTKADGSLTYQHQQHQQNHQHQDYNNHGGYVAKDHQSGTGGLNQHHQKTNTGHIDLDNHHLNVIGGSTGHSTEACRNVVSGTHIPYPGHCGKFLVCMEGADIVEKECPPNTHFNAKMEICDWPRAAQCPYENHKKY